MDDNISKSKKILISMTRRVSRNKWIMGGLIGALVVAIFIKWIMGALIGALVVAIFIVPYEKLSS